MEQIHSIDIIMTTMACQITSLTVVYSTVYSDADQSKHQSSASLTFVWGIHRDRWIPLQRASYAENVSIWWRHHVQQNLCNKFNSRRDTYNLVGDKWPFCSAAVCWCGGIDCFSIFCAFWSHSLGTNFILSSSWMSMDCIFFRCCNGSYLKYAAPILHISVFSRTFPPHHFIIIRDSGSQDCILTRI